MSTFDHTGKRLTPAPSFWPRTRQTQQLEESKARVEASSCGCRWCDAGLTPFVGSNTHPVAAEGFGKNVEVGYIPCTRHPSLSERNALRAEQMFGIKRQPISITVDVPTKHRSAGSEVLKHRVPVQVDEGWGGHVSFVDKPDGPNCCVSDLDQPETAIGKDLGDIALLYGHRRPAGVTDEAFRAEILKGLQRRIIYGVDPAAADDKDITEYYGFINDQWMKRVPVNFTIDVDTSEVDDALDELTDDERKKLANDWELCTRYKDARVVFGLDTERTKDGITVKLSLDIDQLRRSLDAPR